MVCTREKNKIIGRKEKEKKKKNLRHVVPVQERQESVLAVLLWGCVPALGEKAQQRMTIH